VPAISFAIKATAARSVQIVALELGVREAIIAISPAVAQSIVALEHPILVPNGRGEFAFGGVGKIKIAFAGHGTPGQRVRYFRRTRTRLLTADSSFTQSVFRP